MIAGTESLEDFYKSKFDWLPDNLGQDIGHFNVFRLEDCHGPNKTPVKYTRRDYYKVTLFTGKCRYHYADKSVDVDGKALMFFNPNVPYTFESMSDDMQGYFCIFKEGFFTERLRSNISDLPMFTPGGKPSYALNDEQYDNIAQIFEKMLNEIASDYRFKYDLLNNYVNEVIHYALKLQPTETLYRHPDANSRITSIFTELLERQFPIESTSQRFTLRSANDFADKLSVHVNHLNRAIRQTTGRTTTSHIFERLANEARVLLRHTTWNISEISYTLGFDEPAHFNNFFKKQTQLTPSAYRNV
ncbi:AraC family transcriptional regulator [Mucilaginibacter sp. UR6-1]|uniref:helix-turn-helix domain-containing protein n=1 Tax=Mucilaginibacter sp. UR6-1 TaxID=1435643 RepID=UPI001E346F78|nr:helix-turn-helix domain-containing protein [Mucilaginibacter sp. UR6-1]MCC8410140.1 AraC family transcriptional regulator [Mucilaginibacter sp. UR6-1]